MLRLQRSGLQRGFHPVRVSGHRDHAVLIGAFRPARLEGDVIALPAHGAAIVAAGDGLAGEGTAVTRADEDVRSSASGAARDDHPSDAFLREFEYADKVDGVIGRHEHGCISACLGVLHRLAVQGQRVDPVDRLDRELAATGCDFGGRLLVYRPTVLSISGPDGCELPCAPPARLAESSGVAVAAALLFVPASFRCGLHAVRVIAANASVEPA